MAAPLPPAGPTHIIRSHLSPITSLAFSDDNERLYSGDSEGRVVVTSTRSLRPVASWSPHTDALLGVEELGDRIITHARDNKLHVWTRTLELPASQRIGGTAATPTHSGDGTKPMLCFSMDVNALNFCRFSLLRLCPTHLDTAASDGERFSEAREDALIALPNLVDSEVADIWALTSRERIHAAIGQAGKTSSNIFSTPIGGRSKTGLIMSLHLFTAARESVVSEASSSKVSKDELRLLCAYENGSVTLRRYARTDKKTSVEGAGWEIVWDVKLHVESIMAMKVSRTNEFALTVSADNLIGKYGLSSTKPPNTAEAVHRTKYPGNTAIAIRDDGKVCAVTGWDGHIRLYATRTMKQLGTLKYHKTNCQAVEFARLADTGDPARGESDDGSDDEMNDQERINRTRWMTAGGKDNRVSIWGLIDFSKS